jgi:hypothetical protein
MMSIERVCGHKYSNLMIDIISNLSVISISYSPNHYLLRHDLFFNSCLRSSLELFNLSSVKKVKVNVTKNIMIIR